MKHFYDPHPGRGGPVIPLPLALKATSDALAGTSQTIESALAILRSVGDLIGAKIEAHDEMLLATLKDTSGRTHSWRLLRYKDIRVES